MTRPLLLALAVVATPSLASADENNWIPRGQGVRIVDWADTPAHGPAVSRIIYLNRCIGGCNIASGPNNAISNSWPTTPPGGAVLSEFQHGEQVWQDVMNCVRETYAPYNVTITDVDPGGVPHHEAIVAGTNVENGDDMMVLGRAAGVGCNPVNNVMSMNYANSHPPDGQYICETVAQESAHTWGLDHAYHCSDPMTYLPNCGGSGRKFFRNKNFPCGEFSERECGYCGGPTQNSHLRLFGMFGMGQPIPIPTVSISMPAGTTAGPAFPIYAVGMAVRGFGKAEFWLNGYKWGEAEGYTGPNVSQGFQYVTPTELPDGVIDIEVRIYDDLEYGYGTATKTITKGAPCTSADQCLEGQKCEAGKCFWDPPMGDFGAACEYDQYCLSGQCPEGTCTTSCIAGVTGGCPDGYVCGSGNYCIGTDGGGGGCCSVGQSTTATLLGQLGLGALVLGGLFRRRRPRR
jgi:MYXO-CTERM domain-containing protein